MLNTKIEVVRFVLDTAEMRGVTLENAKEMGNEKALEIMLAELTPEERQADFQAEDDALYDAICRDKNRAYYKRALLSIVFHFFFKRSRWQNARHYLLGTSYKEEPLR